MGLGHGSSLSWWNLTGGTDSLRTYIATNKVVQSGLVLNLDAGVSASYPVPSGLGYQNVTGVGETPANVFDLNVNSFSQGGVNAALTWTGNIFLGTGKYYIIVQAWGDPSQGPIGGVTLTVGGVDYTTDYSTLRGTNTDILGQTIGQGGTVPGGSEQRRSNLTPLGSGALTSITLSAVGGGFRNYFYAVVFVPSGVSDTNFANHVVVNNIATTTWTDLSDKISSATGALPIYNTTDNGVVKGSGTRTDTNASSLVLAIPMDGANNGTTFTDESATIRGSGSAKSITRFGDTKTSTTQSKFYGSSGFFDGTGDYLNLGTSSDYLFGTGDFTIEGWFYLTSDSTRQDLMGNYTDANTGWGIQTSFGVAGQIGFYYGNTIILDSAARVWSPNSWTHFAITRSGTSLKLFVNGVNTTTTTNSTNISTTSYNTLLGAVTSFGSGSPQLFCTGYLQDFRVYKGVAKYTANFTPPLLNNGTLTNGPTYSSANGGSIVFDGTNDYVIGNTPSGLNLSQPCSVNTWVYFNNFTQINPRIIEVQDSSYSIQIIRDGETTRFATKNSNFQSGLTATTWFVPSTSTWYNISVVWQPSTSSTTLYLNGIVQSSVGSTLVGAGNQANKYVLGDRSDFVGTTQLAGRISSTTIYNRALSAAEISQNYNALRGRFGI